MTLTGWTPKDGDYGHRTPFKYSPRPIKTNIKGVLNATRLGNRARGFTGRDPEAQAFNPVFTSEDLYRFNKGRFQDSQGVCKSCNERNHITGAGLCPICDTLLRHDPMNLMDLQGP